MAPGCRHWGLAFYGKIYGENQGFPRKCMNMGKLSSQEKQVWDTAIVGFVGGSLTGLSAVLILSLSGSVFDNSSDNFLTLPVVLTTWGKLILFAWGVVGVGVGNNVHVHLHTALPLRWKSLTLHKAVLLTSSSNFQHALDATL